MIEWEVTTQSSVRVTPLLYFVFLLMYLHKSVSHNFSTPCDVHFEKQTTVKIKLTFWTRVRFSILDWIGVLC